LNDFSARDVQLDEMECGFGPMKTKNFGSAISSVVVHRDALTSSLDELETKVIINGKTIVESTTKGKLYSFQEAIAYASWEEQFVTLEVQGIGNLTNKVI